MKIIESIEQGTAEWLQLRVGRPTASRFKDCIAGGQGKTRKSYMIQLAAETLSGAPTESFSNSAMEWGTETEPQARAQYEFATGNNVKEVSFIHHDTMKAGYSPDGLVGDDGLVEFKCPKTTTHIETVLSGKMPTGHNAQVQGGLWLSGRKWCDFVSFDPRINGKNSMFIFRVNRDENYIADLEKKISMFESELAEMLTKLEG